MSDENYEVEMKKALIEYDAEDKLYTDESHSLFEFRYILSLIRGIKFEVWRAKQKTEDTMSLLEEMERRLSFEYISEKIDEIRERRKKKE